MARKYPVRFRPLAEEDLFAVYEYIAQEAGSAVAGEYLERIENACMALETFPRRGTARDDIRPGLRVLGFEGRISIAFQVLRDSVEILRVFTAVASVRGWLAEA